MGADPSAAAPNPGLHDCSSRRGAPQRPNSSPRRSVRLTGAPAPPPTPAGPPHRGERKAALHFRPTPPPPLRAARRGGGCGSHCIWTGTNCQGASTHALVTTPSYTARPRCHTLRHAPWRPHQAPANRYHGKYLPTMAPPPLARRPPRCLHPCHVRDAFASSPARAGRGCATPETLPHARRATASPPPTLPRRGAAAVAAAAALRGPNRDHEQGWSRRS